MSKKYKWIYRIVDKKDVFTIKEGEWITDLPASKICTWFENIGYEVNYLNRVCEMYLEVVNKVPFKNTYASVVVYKEKNEK